jgi:hypothetical protein
VDVILITTFVICCVIAGMALLRFCCYWQEYLKKNDEKFQDSNWFIREILPTVFHFAFFISITFIVFWIPIEYFRGTYFGFNLIEYYIIALVTGMILNIIIISRKNSQEAKASYGHDAHPNLTRKGERLASKYARNDILAAVCGLFRIKLCGPRRGQFVKIKK